MKPLQRTPNKELALAYVNDLKLEIFLLIGNWPRPAVAQKHRETLAFYKDAVKHKVSNTAEIWLGEDTVDYLVDKALVERFPDPNADAAALDKLRRKVDTQAEQIDEFRDLVAFLRRAWDAGDFAKIKEETRHELMSHLDDLFAV